nr:bacillithiol system redox-active protein YtxJ [Evansella cellulosilytica]
MSIQKIQSSDQFQRIQNEGAPFFLLKNSTTCPISHEAYNETEAFADDQSDIPVYYLNVQESRDLSNEIAAQYNVKHESPQALLFSEGSVKWHASHWKVTKKSLKDAWANI